MRFLLPLFVLGCAGAGTTDDNIVADSDAGCEYPAAVEPMALNQVINAYSWAQALLADGTTKSLDLAQAHCNTTEGFDWSPHDYMLLVSVPAW